MTDDTPRKFLLTWTLTEAQWFGNAEQAAAYARDFAPAHSADTMDIDVEEMT